MHIVDELERIQFILNCNVKTRELHNLYVMKHYQYNTDEYNSMDYDYLCLSFHYFNQLWSNGGCGWAGKGQIVTQAFCYSQNFVAISKKYNLAFVFINKYAYTCKVNEVFNKALLGNKLPGYAEIKEGKTELEIIEFSNEK